MPLIILHKLLSISRCSADKSPLLSLSTPWSRVASDSDSESEREPRHKTRWMIAIPLSVKWKILITHNNRVRRMWQWKRTRFYNGGYSNTCTVFQAMILSMRGEHESATECDARKKGAQQKIINRKRERWIFEMIPLLRHFEMLLLCCSSLQFHHRRRCHCRLRLWTRVTQCKMERRLYDEHVHNSTTFIKPLVPQATHVFHWLWTTANVYIVYLSGASNALAPNEKMKWRISLDEEEQKKTAQTNIDKMRNKQRTADWCHRAQIMNNLINKSRTAATEY